MAVLHLSAPDPVNPPRESDPAAEAVHLRRLIETQPFCLMRVGMDGVLLAANDAALGLLGARELDQVLGSAVTVWMDADHQDRWREFAATLASGTSGSLECELTGLSSNHRTVVFYGVPLLDHADGTRSMILGVRDISESRRIEAALQARESDRPQATPQHVEQIESQRVALEQLRRLLRDGRTHLQNLRTQLQHTESERDRLATCLEETASVHERQMAEQATERVQLQQTLGEQHERDLLLKDEEAEHRQNDLHAQIDAAGAEQRRLATCLEETESAHQRQMAEQAAERAQLQQTLGEQHEHDLRLKDEEAEHRQNDLHAQIDAAGAEQRRLATCLEETESAHQRQMAEQAAERAQLQQTLGEQHEHDLRLKDEEAEHRQSDLHAQIDAAAAEQRRLATCLEETASAHERQTAEQAAERAQLQRTLAEQHERDLRLKDQEAQHRENDLRAQMDAAAANRDQLSAFLEETENVCRQFAEQVSAERAEHVRVLEAATLVQTKMAKELADHRVELQSMDLNMRQLAPLAASGRLALEVGRELSKVAETIDGRAAGLLAQCPLEAASRSEIEALRSEAIHARSLVNQIPQMKADAPAQPSDSSNPSEERA